MAPALKPTHLRFEAREDVTTAPALAVGDKPSIAKAHELRGDKLQTPSSAVSLLAAGLSTNRRRAVTRQQQHCTAYNGQSSYTYILYISFNSLVTTELHLSVHQFYEVKI